MSANINYFYQFDVSDRLTLVEGEQEGYFLFFNRTYKSVDDFIEDLTNILNTISPNNLNYSCTVSKVTNNLEINVIDSMAKSIKLNSENLMKLLGLDNVNSFSSKLIGFKPINLNPRSQVYICSDLVRTYNQNEKTNNILCSYPYEFTGKTKNFHILENACETGKINSFNIWVIDSEGKRVDIYGGIYIEIVFFSLETLDDIKETNDINTAFTLKLLNK